MTVETRAQRNRAAKQQRIAQELADAFPDGTLLRVVDLPGRGNLRVFATPHQEGTWFELKPGDLALVVGTRLSKKRTIRGGHPWTLILTRFGLVEGGVGRNLRV